MQQYTTLKKICDFHISTYLCFSGFKILPQYFVYIAIFPVTCFLFTDLLLSVSIPFVLNFYVCAVFIICTCAVKPAR